MPYCCGRKIESFITLRKKRMMWVSVECLKQFFLLPYYRPQLNLLKIIPSTNLLTKYLDYKFLIIGDIEPAWWRDFVRKWSLLSPYLHSQAAWNRCANVDLQLPLFHWYLASALQAFGRSEIMPRVGKSYLTKVTTFFTTFCWEKRTTAKFLATVHTVTLPLEKNPKPERSFTEFFMLWSNKQFANSRDGNLNRIN